MGKEEASLMKKSTVWIKVIVIMAVIAAMAAAIVVLLKTPEKEDDTPKQSDVPQYNVYKKGAEEIEEIRLKNESGEIVFKNTSDGWSIDGVDIKEVSSKSIESLVDVVGTIISNNEIEKNPSDLSVYGLDKPVITAEIYCKDGSNDKFFVGSQSPVTKEYFFMMDGIDTVYSIYEAKVTQMKKDKNYYQDFSRFSVNVEALEEIEIKRERNTIHLKVRDDINSAALNYNVWQITQPYDDVYNAIDQFVDDKVIEPMSKLDIRTVAPEMDDYGLDSPEFTLTVKFAELDESKKKTGEYSRKLEVSKNINSKRYVRLDGYNDIYEINSADAEFMNVNEFLIISKLALLRDIANTSDVIILKGNDEIYKMQIGHSDDNKSFTFKINGEDSDEEESKKKYQSIIGISADDIYKGEALAPDADITIKFTGYNGYEDMIVEFISIDDLSYAIRKNGKINFTVKKSDVAGMIENIGK